MALNLLQPSPQLSTPSLSCSGTWETGAYPSGQQNLYVEINQKILTTVLGVESNCQHWHIFYQCKIRELVLFQKHLARLRAT